MADGELPRAVAAGSNSQLVRAPRAASVVAVLVALFVFALFTVREVPGRALALIGGHGQGVARWGGVVGTYVPPAGTTPAIGPELGDDPNIAVSRDGDHYVVEIARVKRADAPDVIAKLSAGGGLEFREVIESRALTELARLGLVHESPRRGDDWVAEPYLEVDQWRGDEAIESHTDLYLYAHDRAAIERVLAEAQRQGWAPPAGTQVAFEKVAPFPEAKDPRDAWRTYLVSTTVALDGTDVANATGTYDPNTNRPMVTLDFNRKGTRAFGDLTARIQGHKLATMLGGVVKSAPVINGPIRGGRASITMGGGDPTTMEHERDVLVDVLKTGSLPLGGQLHDLKWVAPQDSRDGIARIGLALLAGVLAFLGAFAVIRIARPERARADQLVADVKRPVLASRVGWTAFALVVYAVGTYLTVPGINEVELTHIVTKGHSHLDVSSFSVFALGIMPLLTAFVSVEVLASIVPRWRRLRDTLRGRRKLELAVTIVAIALCCVQAYFIVSYMLSLSRGGAEIFNESMRWPAMFTVAAGPMLLAVLASAITNRGLGNGYAVLFVFAWLWRNPWWDLPEVAPSELVRVGATILLTATIAHALLGWRITSPGRVAVPLPSASIAPLQDGGGALALVGTLTALGVTLPFSWLDAMQSTKHSLAIGVTVIVVFTLVWAFAFARPGRRRSELAAAGFEPTDREQWMRSVLITAAGLAALFAIALLPPLRIVRSLADPALVIIATATVGDLVAEWRARKKTELVAVWQLHDPLLVDAAHARLALADIPHFIHATRMRSLLWIFGSYVPMTVYAPTAHAEAAHANMRTWLDA